MSGMGDGVSLAIQAKRELVRAPPHPVYRMYRRRRVAWQVANFGSSTVEDTYAGHRLRILVADPLGEGWYDHDWQGLPELDELSRVGALRPGATVFDNVPHQGVVALVLASEVGESGRVIAVEAEPHNAEVGSRVGNFVVVATTIDELASSHGTPDLVFLDIEDFEGKALDGAEAVLEAGRTTFFVEVHVGQLVDADARGILDRFRGYRVTIAREREDGQVATFGPVGDPLPDARFFLAAAP